MSLTPEHAEYLAAHAVDLELAQELGVRSVATVEELPEEWRSGIGRHLPGIIFPWTSHDGRQCVQLRPDTAPSKPDGEKMKYVFQTGVPSVLWQMRPEVDGQRVLLVEGSKQCMVAAMYAPEDFEVYGMAGCWGWSHDSIPVADLSVVENKEVVVIFDADAGTNPDVYNAGIRLAGGLKMEGATKVSWVRLPAGKKAGLDDLLATRDPGRRAAVLGRLIEGAKPKVADTKPKARTKKAVEPDENRPPVRVDGDRLYVIGAITDALIQRWDGTEVFNHGGVISRLIGGTMHPVEKGTFNDLVINTVSPVIENPDGSYAHCWPDSNTMITVLANSPRFTPLERITSVPFVRPNGTVCASPGYDADTKTLFAPPEDLGPIEVPTSPTSDEVRAARNLLLGDWLADMPFPDDASRANALALILTPFIRGLVYLAPLAVVDGLQMGVGKNLLADCLSILVTGKPADPKLLNDEDDENRKMILSVFRAGQELLIFDEAHTIQGNSLARAVTALTYSDRVLGVSTMAEFPNRATWVSLGNQVQVRGDMTRRVYRIALAPDCADPHNRLHNTFRHPDLRGWTSENRARLITACLTLVRAWFAEGCPPERSETALGSFEKWQQMAGGILQTAEVPGFLGNLSQWRSESDSWSQWWSSHLAWLREQFGDNEFTCREVRSKAMADPSEYEAPLNLDDVADKSYAKKLGEAYSRIKMRRFGALWIEKVGAGHRGVAKWRVHQFVGPEGSGSGVGSNSSDDDHTFSPANEEKEGSGGTTGTSTPYTHGKTLLSSRAHAHTRVHGNQGGNGPCGPSVPPDTFAGPIVFDLETGDANEMHRYGPGFVRLAGWTECGSGKVELTTDLDNLVRRIEGSSLVIGHNVIGYDLQALARYHGLDLSALVRRGAVFDTLLAARQWDPPMAKEKGVDHERRYNLDHLGHRFELGGKVHDLKALAKEHGGFDKIPVDDPLYREYLVGDVELSEKVYDVLTEKVDEVGAREYVAREHGVAAVAAQISLNGFRVDLELLADRVKEGETRKQIALGRLHDRYGVPLLDPKGKPYASPLATKAGKAALIAALESEGVTSFWTTGKSGDIATSYEAMHHLALQHHHKPKVVEICKLVAAVVTIRTVYSTISDNLIGDRVHPSVVMKQSTGRWSLSRPGLTVMGKRGGRYREREVFIADPGELIVAFDLSQVDMRALAGLSGDEAYINMLRTSDPHSEIAQALFGDASKRDEAKAIGHGWNYGRGVRAISDGNDLPPDLVQQFDQSMRERFPRLVEWREEVRTWAESGELLDNGFGRRMRPDPNRAHTQGPALMGQGCARDLMMEGLLRLPDEILPMLRAQVHDEIVLSVPEDGVVDVERAVIEALSFEWRDVPILADGGPAGHSWGEIYRKEPKAA